MPALLHFIDIYCTQKKEWAFHCWKVHSYADCELYERQDAFSIAGIYRTILIV